MCAFRVLLRDWCIDIFLTFFLPSTRDGIRNKRHHPQTRFSSFHTHPVGQIYLEQPKPDDNICNACNQATLKFEPPSLYCTGCGQRIKRNQTYYTTPATFDSGLKGYWCHQCYTEIRTETFQLDGAEVYKSQLEKKKNDEEVRGVVWSIIFAAAFAKRMVCKCLLPLTLPCFNLTLPCFNRMFISTPRHSFQRLHHRRRSLGWPVTCAACGSTSPAPSSTRAKTMTTHSTTALGAYSMVRQTACCFACDCTT